jgi:hypothetical protein
MSAIKPLVLAAPIVLSFVLAAPLAAGEPIFVRGDANFDGRLDLADPIFALNYSFRGGRRPPCLDAADANDDGGLDISDSIYVLNFLFLGTRAPKPPYPVAGADPTPDEIGCAGDPVPVEVLRHGSLVELAHAVAGRVKYLSSHEIVIENFFYDGDGFPDVVVWLHRDRATETEGVAVSPSLIGHQYVNETLVYPVPPEVTADEFGFVSIWCTWFPLNYGYARLYPGDFP